MSAMRGIRSLASSSSPALLALFCLFVAAQARADTILVAQTSLISGTVSTVDSFNVTAPGTVTVELSNIPWPQALSSLSFTATSASQVLSSWMMPTSSTPGGGETVQSFQVTPGTYFAHITGSAAGSLDLGLYSVTMSFAPAGTVPLPDSGWLLAGALLALLALARLCVLAGRGAASATLAA
jgi:hypothetical protein